MGGDKDVTSSGNRHAELCCIEQNSWPRILQRVKHCGADDVSSALLSIQVLTLLSGSSDNHLAAAAEAGQAYR